MDPPTARVAEVLGLSRRLPASRLLLMFVLLAGAILPPLLAPTAEAFGERPYEWNQVINGTNHLDVYSGESVAQSFVATESYELWNVTLRLRNTGDTTDAINVTIRSDSAGAPAAAYLAASNLVIGNTVLGQYTLAFSAPPVLTKGARYWIVATCPSILANTHEWHHSAANVYADGKTLINLSLGAGWQDPATPTDLYFVTYGREVEANLTASLSSQTTGADPGELVTFRVFLNNTGSSAASIAWLNDILLPGFTYVSDTATSAGASTPFPSFTFLGVGNGPRSFDLVARVNVGTEPGTVLSKMLSLEYRDGSGALRDPPDAQVSILIGKHGKAVYLSPDAVGASERLNPARPTGGTGSQSNEIVRRDDSRHDFDLAPALARDFRVQNANATLYLDSPNHDVRNLDVNLTLSDWNGVTLVPLAYVQRRVTTNGLNDFQPFAFDFPALDHVFAAGGRIRLTIINRGTSQSDLILAMNSTFADSRVEFETTTYVRVDALDLRDAVAPASVWSPRDALVVRANVSDPFGSGEIAVARIDITTPAGTRVVDATQMTLFDVDPGTPSAWKVFEFAYGPPLLEGSYAVSVTAFEANGVSDTSEATALVRVPAFTLSKTATAVNVRSGDRFTYDVWYNNTGSGPAGRVWINDTLPTGLTFLSSSDPAAMTGNYNWTWTSVAPGNQRLRIDVQVQGGLQQISYFRNTVFLSYTDEKGFPGSMLTASVDAALRGPVISLTKTSPRTTLHESETITYTFTIQNTGDPAETLWLNDTLPSGLTYVGDTAASLGGTVVRSGNNIYFTFTDMPGLTTQSFTLTAQAGPGLARGTVLTNVASLNFTNTNGFLLPPKTTSWSVTVVAPEIASVGISIARTQAVPGDVIGVVATFANTGNEPASDVWMNLTFDPYIVFLNASMPASVSANEVRFALRGIAVGPTSIFLNVSVDPTVADRRLLAVGGTMTYTDGFGNVRPIVTVTPDSFEASVPRILLSVTPDRATVEAGALAFFSVYQVNAGSGVAGDVWLSLPLPAGFLYVNDTADGSRTVFGSTYMWHWRDFAPGTRFFTLRLQAKTSVANGTGASLVFHTDYTDANGNFRLGNTTQATVTFVAPTIELTLQTGSLQPFAGDPVTYTLTLRNLGGSPARNLWLTDAIDPRFEFVSYASRVQATGTGTGRLNWSYVDLGPGTVETVVLVLRILDGTPSRSLLANMFEALYTNSDGSVIGYAQSNTGTVLVAVDYVPYLLVGLAAVVAGSAAVYLLRRTQGVQIEEVFLVYRDGVLIYHLSRSLTQDKDEDVLSGMLTAVQEFVRDAFAYGEHRELHQLDFGDYRIMIERGRTAYLAVVYSGKGSSSVRRKVRAVLDRIELDYAPVLEKWDGDMDSVVGVRDLIREYLLKANGRHLRSGPKPT